MRPTLLAALIGLICGAACAQDTMRGTVQGIIRADSSGEALPSVSVALVRHADSSVVTGTVTDKEGTFRIDNISPGEYFLRCSSVGYRQRRSKVFVLSAAQPVYDAGIVRLREEDVQIDAVTVTALKPVVTNEIDRKVYDVQQDIVSRTGSVTDLLQNIPSVQVDVDGTVSLRGSPNVQVLVNGKPSPLLAGGNSDALQQIPASSVERIEVITNPSAKYKPEGTAGMLNIVLKKDADLGANGTLGANVGNSTRYNASATGNYNPGKLNFFGTYNFRQDERNTYTSDIRAQIDSNQIKAGDYAQVGHAFARPYSHFATLGVEYRPSDDQRFGLSGIYRRRGYTSTDTSAYLLSDNTGAVTSNYDRRRVDYDQTPFISGNTFYEHDFEKDDHTLRFEFNASHLFDEEDNHFTNVYYFPAGLITYDNRRINEYNDQDEFTVDYHRKLAGGSIIEAGYDGFWGRNDFPYTGNYVDSTGALVEDPALTNHFKVDGTIHAFYGTWQEAFGAFGMLAGLREEGARRKSDLITTGKTYDKTTWKLYPTLHLAYKLSELEELQLNYSLRVNRPDPGSLNPFPEYQNPRNLRAGNPLLQPEYVHSIEFGYRMQRDQVSLTPGIYYRNRYNGFTSVTVPLNDSTLLTTQENLSTDQSGGVELIVTGDVGSTLSLNLSGNGFYEEIDASNLGYEGKKSAVSWNGSLNCNFHLTGATMLQLNSNYRSTRLTPQGTTQASFVLNLGGRQDLVKDKLSLTATISDVLGTLSRKTDLQTSWLTENLSFTRDSRVIFIGLTYRFGTEPKKPKDKSLQYDDNG